MYDGVIQLWCAGWRKSNDLVLLEGRLALLSFTSRNIAIGSIMDSIYGV